MAPSKLRKASSSTPPVGEHHGRPSMRRILRYAFPCFSWLLLCTSQPFGAAALAQGGSYVNFETIPERALALSPDGSLLFATNTPASRLEIFRVTPSGLVPQRGVQVGLDPVAVAAR